MCHQKCILRSLLFFLFTLTIISIFSCDLLTEQKETKIYLEKHTIADGFGNHNGAASRDELDFINDYFKDNHVSWCIGAFPSRYWESNIMPADTVIWAFKLMKLIGPYVSEEELRKAFEGINIRIPFVGVYVVRQNQEYEIYKYFRAPGPNISIAEWIEIRISL